MKNKWSLLCLMVVIVVLLAACGSNSVSNNGGAINSDNKPAATKDSKSANKVKLTFLNSKSEIQQQLEDAVKVFGAEHENVEIEILATTAGQSPFEKASQLYASGNPATILMLDPADVASFKDRIIDLSGEKWVGDAIANSTTVVDGKVLDFPLAVEGFSLMYNQAVLDQAVGGTFDPATIQTRENLKQLFDQIEASGKKAMHISPLDWSLGAHFMNALYADQSANFADVETFIDDLRAGKADLANNTVFNGVMDTFDLLMEYNSAKDQPLTPTYELGPELLGTGEVGVWFMGNWAWPNIKEFDESGSYGFIPVPISNDASDYGNSQIATAVTKRLVIDGEKSSAEQQEVAKAFLNWLVYEESGQDFLINKSNIIPAFNGIALEPQDPLAKSIQSYMAAGKMTVGMTILPADHWSNVGASMQKYLAKAADRATLVGEIESYWKNVK